VLGAHFGFRPKFLNEYGESSSALMLVRWINNYWGSMAKFAIGLKKEKKKVACTEQDLIDV
jgi:hypothetical protein